MNNPFIDHVLTYRLIIKYKLRRKDEQCLKSKWDTCVEQERVFFKKQLDNGNKSRERMN